MSTSIVLIDSTVRLRWEMTKAEFDRCVFGQNIVSPIFAVGSNNHNSKWVLRVYPKGKKEANRNMVIFTLQNRHHVAHTQVASPVQWGVKLTLVLTGDADQCCGNSGIMFPGRNDPMNMHTLAELSSAGIPCRHDCLARYDIAVETEGGYWPDDAVKHLYALTGQGKVSVFDPPSHPPKCSEYYVLCSTQDFGQRFQNDKITVVTTLVIYGAGVDYLDHEEAAKDYVKNVRLVPDLDSLANITIVCQGKRFNCHKTVLATMSTKFAQNFKDKNAKVIKITDSTVELVEQMINFVNSGLIPDNINETAGELIKISTSYGIEALTKVCETALIKNLSSENVISTFLSFDEFVPKSEQRKKILEFIKTERKKIVKSEDWEMFCINHPNLIAEILETI